MQKQEIPATMLPTIPPCTEKLRRRAAAVLAIVYLSAYLLPLGVRPLIRPDEFRYAEIPREMIASGNWWSPRFVGFRYYEKPVLGYQLTALSIRCFGENAFAVRLPSALAAGVTALLLWQLLSAMAAGWLAPLGTAIFLGFGIVYGIGTFAVLDFPLCAAVTASWCAFFFAWRSERAPARSGWLAAAGAAAGLGFLQKGFVAFALPALAAGAFLIWRKEWKNLLLLPWIPLAAALAVALPGAWMLHRGEPDFWRYFIVVEHFNRFTASTGDRHPQPFWYFLPVLAVGMLPSGFLAAAAWSGWKREFFRRPGAQFLLCAFALPFLFFSASSCKLGTYILPCFVPLAGLIAWGILEGAAERPLRVEAILDRLFLWFGWFCFAAGGLLALACPVSTRFFRDLAFLPWAQGAALALCFWGALLVRSRRRPLPLRGALFLLGVFPVLWFVPGTVPAELWRDRAATAFREFGIVPGDLVLVDRTAAGMCAWQLRRADLVLVGKSGEFTYGVKNAPASSERYLADEKEIPRLLAERKPAGCVYLVVRDLRRRPPAPGVAALMPRSRNAFGITCMRLK